MKKTKTVIACIKTKRGKVIMAGDRRITMNDSIVYSCPYAKIKKHKSGILIGGCGDVHLVKLIVHIFESPLVQVNDADTYMYNIFRPKLIKFLSQHKYADGDNLKLALKEHCALLVVVLGRLFVVELVHQDESGSGLVLDEAPLPWAMGSGADTTYPSLIEALQRDGQNTKEHLKTACELAAQIHPSVGLPLDYIQD